MYVNADLKLKAGDFTSQEAQDFLNRHNVDTQALQASLKSYCRTYCDGAIC